MQHFEHPLVSEILLFLLEKRGYAHYFKFRTTIWKATVHC